MKFAGGFNVSHQSKLSASAFKHAEDALTVVFVNKERSLRMQGITSIYFKKVFYKLEFIRCILKGLKLFFY